jgi:hypothetical protein
MNYSIEHSYVVGRLLDSVRPAFNPNSGSLLDQAPYSLAESLLELPNNSRVASKDIVLAIHQPEFTGYRSSSHYPPYTFYYRVGKTPAVPKQVVQLERSSALANTVDNWPPGVLSPDLLNILNISKSVSILGKTYYRGKDYDLSSPSNPTGIRWLAGGSRPPLGTQYSILIEYSTREFNEARLRTGLIELEMLPTLTSYNLDSLFYRVDYLSLPVLSSSQKQAIATDPTVFDERNFSPFHTERWRVPPRLSYKRELIRIELDENGLLTKGTLTLQNLIWVYKPFKLELTVKNLSNNSENTIEIPNTNNSTYLVSPEGIIWVNSAVLQPYVNGLLDPTLYKLYWYFSYQPAYGISDVYWRVTRPGVYPADPNYVISWLGLSYWFPLFYYF